MGAAAGGREQPTQATPRAGVNSDHPPPALEAGEFDLVGAHETGPVDVDQLMVEDVVPEQDLLRPAVERAQVELGLAQGHGPWFHLRDFLGGQVGLPPGERDQEASYRRIPAAPEPDDQIIDLPEPLPIAVTQHSTEDLREVEDRGLTDGGFHKQMLVLAP